MKIRIKGNLLRYRLTKRDVEQFSNEGYLQETTNFGKHQLIYALQKGDQDNITASYQDNKIILNMPATMATEWQQTERVGFDGQDGELYLLIEKDFKCLDNVAEDQSDNYPNPLAFHK